MLPLPTRIGLSSANVSRSAASAASTAARWPASVAGMTFSVAALSNAAAARSASRKTMPAVVCSTSWSISDHSRVEPRMSLGSDGGRFWRMNA